MADKPGKPPISREEWEKAQEGWDAAKRAAGAIPPLPPKNSNADPPGGDGLARQLGAVPPLPEPRQPKTRLGTLGNELLSRGEYWLDRRARERREGPPVVDKAEAQFLGGEKPPLPGGHKGFSLSLDDAIFWVGVAIFSDGLYLVTEHPLIGYPLIAAGVAALAWSNRGHMPKPPLRLAVLIIAMTLTCGMAAYDLYDRHVGGQTISSPAPVPGQTAGFGFQPTDLKVPSKNYSAAEKQALLNLIGTISEELNDKGLPVARLAQTTGSNLVTPSKDGLNDAFVRGNSVIKTLSDIQRVIWNEVLQPNNSNFLSDLNFIVDNNAKFDQFQRATDRFTGTIENFQRNLDSLSVDQRNWIASLIQIGPGQVWNQSADEFQAWIQQCNSRMDKERDGLK